MGCKPNKVRGAILHGSGGGGGGCWANLHFTPDLCTRADTSDRHQVALDAQ